jgi:hypothetical protein
MGKGEEPYLATLLVEEDACADLAEEQAGVHLRGESSSINFYGLVCSSMSPLSFPYYVRQFVYLPVPILVPRSAWYLFFCFLLNLHLLCPCRSNQLRVI